MRRLAPFFLISGLAGLGSLIATTVAPAHLAGQSHEAQPSSGKPWTQPRTAWGDPDFDGIWNYATMTPLERPRDVTTDVLSAADAAAYEKRTTDRQAVANNTAGPDWWDPGTAHLTNRRTSLIVDPADGHIPPMTPEAQKAAAARAQTRRRGPAEGPEDLNLNERCLNWATAGPPMLPGVYNNDVEIVQTRGYVVIHNEMIHDARIVPMDGRPRGSMRRWMGESRGHWEGQTLVVETTNFSDKTSFRGADENLHLVERFTRQGPDVVEYRFTVDDPTVWTKPWTAALPMNRIDGQMYEYACHEGNERSVEGTLRGARVQDK